MNYDPYECQMDANTPMEVMPPPSVGPPPSVASAPTPAPMYSSGSVGGSGGGGPEQQVNYSVKGPMTGTPNQWQGPPQQQQQQHQSLPPPPPGQQSAPEFHHRLDSGFISECEPYQLSPYDNFDDVEPFEPNMYSCNDVGFPGSQAMSYDHTPNVYMNESCQMSNSLSNQISANQLSSNQLSAHQLSAGQMTPGGPMSNWSSDQNRQPQQPMYSQPMYNSGMYANENTMMGSASGPQSSGVLTPNGPLPVQPVPADQTIALGNSTSPKLVEFANLEGSCSHNLNDFEGAIPEVAKLLNDDDPVVVSQAASIVMHLSQREEVLPQLINKPELIRALVGPNILASNDNCLDNSVATVLSELSNFSDNGRRLLIEVNAVPLIIKLLGSNVSSIVFHAITTLHSLLLKPENSQQAKAAVYKSPNAFKLLVKLLDRNNFKFLTIVTDCIHLLCYNEPKAKLEFLHHEGTLKLIHILNTRDYEKLLWTTSKVFKVLSVCPRNKLFMVQNNGLQALAKHFSNPSKRLVQNCLWTMRNLSDAAVKCQGLDSILQVLVELLHSSDINIVICVAGILSNLTCNNQSNKLLVYKLRGIPAVLSMLNRHGLASEDLTDPAICALRHLTSGHPQSEEAQNQLREHCGIPVIVKLLNPSSGWPLIKATIGVLRNVALGEINRVQLRECGAINCLMHWMNRACDRLNAAYAQGMTGSIRENDVRLDEIVELTTGSLQRLAHDQMVRVEIKRMNAMPKFIELLINSNFGWSIKRIILELLLQLASDPEVIKSIQMAKCVGVLENLLNLNPPEQVNNYAVNLITKLTSFPSSNSRDYHSSYGNQPQQQPQQQQQPLQHLQQHHHYQQQQTMSTMTTMMSNVGLTGGNGGAGQYHSGPGHPAQQGMLPQFDTFVTADSGGGGGLLEDMDTFDHSF